MIRRTATLFCFVVALWGCWSAQPSAAQPAAKPEAAKQEKVVFLGGGLTAEQVITLTATVEASSPGAIVLLDSPTSDKHVKDFLAAYKPQRVVPVGNYDNLEDHSRRLGMVLAPARPWQRGPPLALWQDLFPQAERVVVCPPQPRSLLLHSACLAGVMKAPLFVIDDAFRAELPRRLAAWKTQTVIAAGSAADACRDLKDVRITAWDEKQIVTAYLREQLTHGPLATFVVANASDTNVPTSPGMSPLAPYVALRHRAVLLLTNEQGTDSEAVVRAALQNPDLARAENLILVADRRAIPMGIRPNPAAGKDTHIEMEPFTPTGAEPFTFATGRLFHSDPAIVPLMLARAALLGPSGMPRRALVVSNPGGGLPLLETFSHSDYRELKNRGYETTGLFEKQVDKDTVRKLLPEQDIFLWEGHHQTLVEKYGLPRWPEPLRPSLIVLQSCLALNEKEALPLLQRGAIGIVGSSTRTYSATGGAFALAYFDALLYDGQSLGSSLRQAKNFLLAYSLLKEKLLGAESKFSGANVRSAWAFSLWGDPTLTLPAPKQPADALAPVRHEVRDNRLTLFLPDKAYETTVVGQYRAEMLPNARLAGWLRTDKGEDSRHLVPFLFAEVRLDRQGGQGIPRLRTKLPDKNWVFCWDARRHAGYLLVMPRSKEGNTIHFDIDWPERPAESGN